MPNHIHAIICIDKPLKEFSKRTTLSVVVGGFKRAITLFAKKNNITFVMVTHDPELAKMAPRVITLKDGRVISDVKNTTAETKENLPQ